MSRALIVEADGGSRGNPGVAGYGALVRDPSSKQILSRRAAPLGKASNNVAEYSGLIAGLEAAVEIDPAAVIEVRMDSKLVIEQMAGRWKIKHEDMKRLALQAQEIVRTLRSAGGSVSWTWIPREQNKDADALSNDGMDGRTVEENAWQEGESASTPHGLKPDLSVDDSEPVAESVAQPSDQPDRPTRVLLVRHGVTDFTVAGRLDGRGGVDPSLNEAGLQQAARVADGLNHKLGSAGAAVFVASGLSRAQQTLAPALTARGIEVDIDTDWDEQSFGEWDDHLISDLVKHNDFRRLRSDPTFAPPGGESHHQMEQRVRAALAKAIAAAPGGLVVVATHRKPIMVVLADILGLDLDHAWLLAIAPGSFTGVELWPDGHGSVSFVNDTNHLRSE